MKLIITSDKKIAQDHNEYHRCYGSEVDFELCQFKETEPKQPLLI
jgi:hypothetical protein